MKSIKVLLLTLLTGALISSCNKAAEKPAEGVAAEPAKTETATLKIISLNGAVTEVISALGHQKEIVAVDVTSTFPEDIKTTAKDLGHTSRITPESIIALKPTHVLGTAKDISPELQEKLKAAGIKVEAFNQEFTIDGAKKLIAEVGTAIGVTDVSALQAGIDTDLKQVKPINPSPKVLFIYARGANMMMVSGTGTAEDQVITLAGGTNAAKDFADFKPLTPEALIKNNPDVILLYDTGLESLGGKAGVLKIPGLDKTTAGKKGNIVTLDGGLVHSFGPRVGQAVTALNALLINPQTATSAK